jgi:diguanylate cyclase (GGDEF)-like protein/PAS domain S-box-containing protein
VVNGSNLFLALLNNAALLLALVVVFEQTLGRAWPVRWVQRVAIGAALGAIVVGVMLVPVHLTNDVVIDARSVLLVLVGAFFGALPTFVAASAAAVYRLIVGGFGVVAWTGVAVIATSALLGVLWRRSVWRDRLHAVRWLELYGLGWVVHLAMLAWLATLPGGDGPRVVTAVAVPVLLIFPFATAAVGLILSRQLRQQRLTDAVRASEERLRRAIDASPVPFMLFADDGRVIDVSQGWLDATGYGRGALTSVAQWADRTFREGEDAAADVMRAFDDGDRPIDLGDRQVRLPDGSERSWSLRVAPLAAHTDGPAGATAAGAPRLAVLAASDVTERRMAERERLLAAQVFENAGEGMLITDAEDRILSANPAVRAITGFEPADLVGRSPSILRSPRDGPDAHARLAQAVARTGRWTGEVWGRRQDGVDFVAALSVATVEGESGDLMRRVVVFSDVTERKLADERMWHQANFDALTSLPNRRLFRERLQQELDRARRSGASVAVLLIDLDRFKDVNDSLGHDQGDALLVEIGRRMLARVRATDVVARMGGDEFAVVLGEVDGRGTIERVVEALLAAAAEPVVLGDEVAYVSASIGITLFPNDGERIETLLRNADQALYVAKAAGRNRWSYFSPEMQAAALEKRAIVRDLREALEAGSLDLAFQPIVDLRTGAVASVEALVRWHHPERGAVPPSVFVPIAEDAGLIVAMGAWVLDEALGHVAAWRARYAPDLKVSVNVSPIQVASGAVPWQERLAAAGVPGAALIVEITEGLLLDERPEVARQLLELRTLGVEVALDDFGTGYSSLAYLRRLDIDFLKIDQAFVRDLGHDPNDLALCEAVVVMAHKLGLRVVGEGVEDAAQCRALQDAGCDFGQGYLFARPMSAAEFDAFLATAAPAA